MLLYFVGRARCWSRPLPLVTSGFIFRRDVFLEHVARAALLYLVLAREKRRVEKREGG